MRTFSYLATLFLKRGGVYSAVPGPKVEDLTLGILFEILIEAVKPTLPLIEDSELYIPYRFVGGESNLFPL